MHAKLQEKDRARELRARGWSLRRIAVELGVALSSVSVWVRNVPTHAKAGVVSARETEATRDTRVQVCGKCARRLPIERFSRGPNGSQHRCKDCFGAYFATRGSLHRRQVKTALFKRRLAARRFLDDYLARHSCRDCGESDSDVLEFDHVGLKHGTVSHMATGGAAVSKLQAEIAECEVVCSNCHRRRTHRRIRSWRTGHSRLEGNAALLPAQVRNLLHLRDVLLRSGCVDCGSSDLLVLEFDHITEKTELVGKLARDGCSLERLQREVARCEVRCANCHRRRHPQERTWIATATSTIRDAPVA